MKKFLKTIIIGIFTVSITTGCVRFSKEDTGANDMYPFYWTTSERGIFYALYLEFPIFYEIF